MDISQILSSLLPAAGMGIGIQQMLQGLGSKKEAQGLFPSYEDPRQLALLAEINQKRKALETGADVQNALSGANQAQGATNQGILKATGGDVGGTIQGLLQSERNTAGARNQAYAIGQSRQGQNTALYDALLGNVAARKMELHLAQSQQKMAEWAQSMKEGRQNFLAGVAMNESAPNFNNQPQWSTSINSDLLNNINHIMNQGASDINDLGGTQPTQGFAPEINDIQTGIA